MNENYLWPLPTWDYRAKVPITTNRCLLRNHPGKQAFKKYLINAKYYKKKFIDRHAFKRHDLIVRRYHPRLLSYFSSEQLKKYSVVEIGCGSGSSSIAFAQLFHDVIGYDISDESITIAKKRAECFNVENTEFKCIEPQFIVNKALQHIGEHSVIILYAVLEHMTEFERISCLEAIWDKMTPNNYLIIGETPNRLCYFDEHSYLQHFLHLLPNYTFFKYSKIREFRHSDLFSNLKEFEFGEINNLRSRRGLGISFHDFEIAFKSNLDECVVCNFSNFTKLNEMILLNIFNKNDMSIPIPFSSQTMHFMVKKPADTAETAETRKINSKSRSLLLKRIDKYLEKHNKFRV